MHRTQVEVSPRGCAGDPTHVAPAEHATGRATEPGRVACSALAGRDRIRCVDITQTRRRLKPLYRVRRLPVSESSGPNNWNQKIIEEFRAHEGKIGGYFEGAHMLPHPPHRGPFWHGARQSGHLSAGQGRHDHRGDERRSSKEPGLVLQPQKHPRITVEVGTTEVPVDATEVTGEERNELWRRLVECVRGSLRSDQTSRVFRCLG